MGTASNQGAYSIKQQRTGQVKTVSCSSRQSLLSVDELPPSCPHHRAFYPPGWTIVTSAGDILPLAVLKDTVFLIPLAACCSPLFCLQSQEGGSLGGYRYKHAVIWNGGGGGPIRFPESNSHVLCMFMCVFACVHACICACVCACVRACACACTRMHAGNDRT